MSKNAILNVPNSLTLLRLLSLPFVIVLFRYGWSFSAAALFVLAALTDCFDGALARRLDQCTPLGLYLDPVVDKIVILTLFYELSYAGLLHPVTPHLFLARELLLNAVRATAGSQGVVVSANWMGKTKATLQTILIAWGLLMPGFAVQFSAGVAEGFQATLAVATWAVLALSWGFLFVFVYWNRRLFRAN